MEELKYTTIFSSTIKPLVSEEKDKYLAMASLLDVGDFIPEVDTEKNIDLLPIAFNACVANRVNKNGDVIDTPTALEIYENFINKPINIEHNRDRVVGAILTAGFSEFGTDKQIKAEELKDHKGPFNITLGGIVWKVVNSNLAKMIEDSADPTGDSYQKISASWELGFSDYQLVVINSEDKNIENAEFITEKTQIDELKANLKSFGGDGLTEDGKFLYRQVIGNIVPLGIGLTETPAAEVKGIVTKKAEASLEKEVEIPVESETESISQEKEINVKNKHKSKDIIMNINSINDITDENLKEVSASAISDFIQKELESASEQFSAEKQEVETALKDAEEKHETLSKDHEDMKTNLEAVQTELEELKAEKLEKERQEAFNNRMALMDEEYELTDEDREVIASDIKDMDEETFAAYGEKMKVLLKSKNKKQLEEKKKEEAAKASEIEASQEQISETEASATEDVVEEVLEETEVKAEVPVSTAAEEPSVYDKYKAAFDMDGFEF